MIEGLTLENIFVAFSIASAITMATVFRYRLEKNKKLLLGYFSFILLGEVVTSHYFLPDIGIGYETGLICWVIFILFFVARKIVLKFDV